MSVEDKLPKDGWVTSLRDLPSVTIETIDHHLLFDATAEDGKPAGGQKGRSNGWLLWRNENVRKIFLNRAADSRFYAKGEVRASMKQGVKYFVWAELSPSGSIIRCHCLCKAGKGRRCKHMAAFLFRLWDLRMQNATSVPPDKSVTKLPAYWKESVSAVADGPLPFASLAIGKLKAPAVGSTDTDADALRTNAHVVVDQPFTVLPGDMHLLPRDNIRKLACELKEARKSPTLVPVLEGNDFQPVYTLSDIVRAEHNYGVRQSGRKASVGPALSKMPSDRLSVNPDVGDAYQHILKTLLGGGVVSEAVRVLPAPSAAEVEGTARWTDHIGTLTPDQVEFLRKKSVCLNAHGCQRIEALTRSQADSTLCKKMRKIRITARQILVALLGASNLVILSLCSIHYSVTKF